jgi:hypothetical protein
VICEYCKINDHYNCKGEWVVADSDLGRTLEPRPPDQRNTQCDCQHRVKKPECLHFNKANVTGLNASRTELICVDCGASFEYDEEAKT